MTSSQRVAVALLVGLLGAACATSTAPLAGGGTQEEPGGSDGGIADAAGGYGWGAEGGGGPTAEDSGAIIVKKDSGTVTPIDSGTVITPVDSGTTTTAAFCTGSTSSYDGSSYTSWCTYDYDYNDPNNDAFTCASNDDCQTHGVTGCCFKPKSSSNCYGDYGGVPQCVPQ